MVSAESGQEASFPLAGMWRWQVLGGLLALAGATSFLWNQGGAVSGPVFIWVVLGALVIVGANNARVEIDRHAVRFTAPPITWLPKIPLSEIEYVGELSLPTLLRQPWSVHWLTFWPFGRALFVKRRNASLLHPSVAFFVANPQELFQTLREFDIPVKQK